MNIEKEFVSYEQALALKELGFDEPCFGRYYYKESYPMLNPQSEETELVFEFGQYIKQTKVTILAPLYQQAFRFFREKYELFHWLNDGGLIPKNQWYFTIRDKSELLPFNWVEDTTYEQAEQECLNKLIEIAKEKKQ